MIYDKDDLVDIDDKIVSYEVLITYQQNEIDKTVTLIADFQNCLSKQNEALKSFVEERENLEVEKSKHSEIGNKIKSHSLNMDQPHAAVKTKELQVVNGDKDKPKDLKAKIAETNKDLKRKIQNGDNECSKNKIQCVKYSDMTINVSKMTIPEIKHNVVHKVLVHDNDIYIGGSNGLLLRHTPTYTHTYDTYTKDDILQIEVIKNNSTLSINVFTRDMLIIFEDVTWYKKRKAIDIPGIGDVYEDDGLLYIPFREGLIKKSGDSSLKMAPSLNTEVHSFVPCSSTSFLALIRFADRLIYTTQKDEPSTFRLINGLTDVRGVKKLMTTYFLCYSASKFWVLSTQNFKVLQQVIVKPKIMFLDIYDNFMVIIDSSNNVHVYTFSRSRSMAATLVYQHHLKGKITSASIVGNNVYVSVGNDIIVIKHTH